MLHYLEQEARKAPAPQSVATIENVSRRQFVGGVLAASGLVLAVRIAPASALEPLKPYATGGLTMPDGYGMAHDPHVYVAIAPDGAVTIVAHRSEMGTGIRTSLPLVIADEMEADWARVKLVQAPGDEPRYGNQDTDGSRSMRHFIQPMRECGAAMRQMLETAAAAKWGVDVSLCRAKAHHVVQLDAGEKGNRKEARLRRAGGSGHGAAGAAARDASLQDAGRIHAHAQGRDQDRRPARHHHGQGRVRRRYPLAGHEVRRDGAAGRSWAERSNPSTLPRP